MNTVSSSKSNNNAKIPDFPGVVTRKPPNPPKYLVKVSTSPHGETHEVVKVIGAAPEPRLPGCSEVPIPTSKTVAVPSKTYTESQLQNFRIERKKIDSKHDVKGERTNTSNDDKSNQIQDRSTNVVINGMIYYLSKYFTCNVSHMIGIRNPVNSVTLSMAGAMSVASLAPPKQISIPRPFPPINKNDFKGGPPLHNRSPDGEILGTISTVSKIDSSHVPYLPPQALPAVTTSLSIGSVASNDSENGLSLSQMVGPDNPTMAIDETWSACWDNEAGAVYYYNHISGEATWIPPTEVKKKKTKTKNL